MERQTEHREHPADTSIETPDHGAIQAVRHFIERNSSLVLLLACITPPMTFYVPYGHCVIKHYQENHTDPNYKPMPLEDFILSPAHRERIQAEAANQSNQE